MDNIKRPPNGDVALPGLSVVIITKNEERNIRDCIESVKGADEIIVVDCFSTDNTLKIAKEYSVRIFQNDNTNNWNINKQYGFDRATKNWVLSIDADERITKELAEEIKSIIQSSAKEGYYISRKNYLGDRWLKHVNPYPDWQLRLFKKGKGWFECKTVHERLILNGVVGYLKAPMIHLNYRDWKHYHKKMNTFISVQAEELIRNNVNFVWFYPLTAIKSFLKSFFRYKKSNTFLHSYLTSRLYLSKYELIWLIPFRPILRFLLIFFLLQGFLDGKDGFRWATLKGYASFMTYVKYYELSKEREYDK